MQKICHDKRKYKMLIYLLYYLQLPGKFFQAAGNAGAAAAIRLHNLSPHAYLVYAL